MGEKEIKLSIFVIPAEAGIHLRSNYLKKLDSRFHGNDKNTVFQAFYETIKVV